MITRRAFLKWIGLSVLILPATCGGTPSFADESKDEYTYILTLGEFENPDFIQEGGLAGRWTSKVRA